MLMIFLYASVIPHDDRVKMTSICPLEGIVGENKNEIEDSCIHDGQVEIFLYKWMMSRW
jgi:hypothetical protein